MTHHTLKAVSDNYSALKAGRRVDLRVLGERDIRVDDNITYQEVDVNTRELTGDQFDTSVVLVSPFWPLQHNPASEWKNMNILGYVSKEVMHPVNGAVLALEADDGLYRALWSGKWNIDPRPGREDVANVKPGEVVKYTHVTSYNGKSHEVGRIANHNDRYDLMQLFGERLPQVLESGFIIVGLEKRVEA